MLWSVAFQDVVFALRPVRAEPLEGVSFSAMPSDDDLLKRALARTDEELAAELRRVVRDLKRRLREGGTPEQLDAMRHQLDAARRAHDRIQRRLKR